MSSPSSVSTPRLVLLDDDARERFHRGVVHILENTGQEIMHPKALDLARAAGCVVGDGNRVTVPEAVLEKALQAAPSSIAIFDRAGEAVMDLGGRRTYYGTGSDLLWRLDRKTGERRKSVLGDVVTAARVAEALAGIDFIMSYAHPHDVSPGKSYLESFAAMVQNSRKPIVCTADTERDLFAMWEIAVAIREGEGALREKPYFIHYAEPVTPLRHPKSSLAKLLLCAEKAVPCVYSPAPMAGATAPLTTAGHAAIGLAECFMGLVIHQQMAPGAPFLMGIGPAVLDMATTQSSYNAPEYLLAYLTVQEMHHHYGLPSWGYAGTTDSQCPDGQAAFEGGLLSVLSRLVGANLCHDMGYMDFGQTGCLAELVLQEEFAAQARRLGDGIVIDDSTLALDVIDEVGPGGCFTTHPHTLEHLMEGQWRPWLSNREGYDRWKVEGGRTLLDRAQEKVEAILNGSPASILTGDRTAAVRAVLEHYEG